MAIEFLLGLEPSTSTTTSLTDSWDRDDFSALQGNGECRLELELEDDWGPDIIMDARFLRSAKDDGRLSRGSGFKSGGESLAGSKESIEVVLCLAIPFLSGKTREVCDADEFEFSWLSWDAGALVEASCLLLSDSGSQWPKYPEPVSSIPYGLRGVRLRFSGTVVTPRWGSSGTGTCGESSKSSSKAPENGRVVRGEGRRGTKFGGFGPSRR